MTPGRTLTSVGAALLLCATIAGCAPAQPDRTALNSWREAQEAAAGGEQVIDVLSAESESGVSPGTAVLNLSAAQRVGAIQFSCYGDATLNLGVVAQAGDTSISKNLGTVECSQGTSTINGSELFGDAEIAQLEVIGSQPSVATAWVAIVLHP